MLTFKEISTEIQEISLKHILPENKREEKVEKFITFKLFITSKYSV